MKISRLRLVEKFVMYSFIASVIVGGFISGFGYPIAIIILPFCLSIMAEKYFETKEKLVTENAFRLKVNEDMANLKHMVSSKTAFSGGNPFRVKS